MPKALIPNAALVSLATSVPPHVFLQKDVLAAAWDVFGPRFPEFETLSSIFTNTGIIKRHGVKPFDWYLEPRGWPERTEAFLEGAEALFVDVAGKALASAHLAGGDIDTVVTVCSTGIATPSLEARVARRMGFRSDVTRVPVFGLGCAGGASGLSIAARLAQARPGSNVLLVAIELCSLALRLDELTKANIVAISLFGDGAAAVDPARRRWRRDPDRECRRAPLARYARHHGLECRSGRIRRHLPPHHPRFRHGSISTQRWCRFSPACSLRWPTSTGSSAIPAAPRSSMRWRPRLRSIRARSTTNGRSSPTTATCRRPPSCSCSNKRARKGLPPRSLLTALGPGFTASCVALRHAA